MKNMVVENINIIDWNLKQEFQNVKITEKSEKSDFYFEISLESKIEGVYIPLVLEISKNELLNNVINWRYQVSTNKSEKISKISEIKSLSNDIREIFNKKRFDKNYINYFLENKISIINEDNKSSDFNESNQEVKNVINIINELDINLFKLVKQEILISESILDKRKIKYTFELSRKLNFSERFSLESKLSDKEALIVSIENIRFVI
jgi:hypothetical protein